MSSERNCVFCGNRISSLRGSKTQFCSNVCRDEFNKSLRPKRKREALKQREATVKTINRVIVHSCLSDALDPFEAARFCKCRLLMSSEKAKEWVAEGSAVDFETRKPIFCDRAILVVGKRKRSPRAALIDRAHLERAYGGGQESLKHNIDTLSRLATEDRANHAEEEKIRFEVLDGLQMAFLNELKRLVPADIYDKEEAENWGRPFTFSIEDERTSHGKDGFSPRFDGGDDDEQSERDFDERELEPTAPEPEDTRSAEQVIEEFSRHQRTDGRRRNDNGNLRIFGRLD